MTWVAALAELAASLVGILAQALADRHANEQELKEAVRIEYAKFDAAVSAFAADLKKNDEEADAAVKAWTDGASTAGAGG
jgi:hypothetical protein